MKSPLGPDYMLATFSQFRNTRSRKPHEQTCLFNFLASIRNGEWKVEVERCRRILKEEGVKAYQAARINLPVVTLSAKLNHRTKNTTLEERCAIASGLIQLDIDPKDNPEMTAEKIRQIVESHHAVIACFWSPSGGVKAIGRCPASFDTHAGSWLAFAAEFHELGLTLDPSTKDVGRLCYVSYDPHPFTRNDAIEIVPLEVPEISSSAGEGSNGTEDPEHVHCVLAHLAKTIGTYKDRDTWLHICACVKDAVGVDAAGEIVDEYFPPLESHHESACAVVAGLTGSWLSLRKYKIDPQDYTKLMPDLLDGFADLSGGEERDAVKPSLRERAYALRFDPNETPPADETCMVIGEVPVAARGNLSAIQGKSKVGKSAVGSAILGAGQRGAVELPADTLCLSWVGESTGAIIHIDTEQSRSDWHGLVSRSVTRSGLPEVSPRLVSLPLVQFARSDRLEILKQAMLYERSLKGSIDLVLIDGVADLCKSPNDEAEALELVSKLMALAQEFNCAIFCVLHENPGTDAGKTRGHLGSELNRKAFANLRIDKDAETSVSTIYGMDMRKQNIPKEHGFCFAWNGAARMHTFQGRAAGLKSARRETEAREKCRVEWEGIFEFAGIGTNGECPELTPEQAANTLRDISGTGKPVKIDAMKKRMQRAESLGVLRKAGAGVWALDLAGQSGQDRDI